MISLNRRNVIALCLSAFLLISAMPVFAQEQAGALTLDNAVAKALEANEQGLIAKEEVKKAEYTLLEGYSAAWPQITLITGYTYNLEEPTTPFSLSALAPLFQAMNLPPPADGEIPIVYRHEWAFTANVDQNIVTFGRITTAVRLAKTYKQINEKSELLTREEVVLQVKKAYWNLVLAMHAQEIADENLKISQQHMENVSAKYNAGIRSEFDMLQSKAELAAAKPALIRAETAVELARKSLLNLIGMPLNTEITPADDFTEFYPAQSQEELLGIAQANRQEVGLANLETKMAKLQANLGISNYMPILAANMAYTWNGQSISDNNDFWPQEDDDWKNFWSVGVTMTWPIFDGFKNYSVIKRNRTEERISRLKYAQLIKGIDLELTQITRQFDSLKQQVQATEETVAVAQKAFELAAIRYDNGLGTALEKSDAQLGMLRAKLAHAQALHELNITIAQLQRALGKDFNEQ